MEIERGYISPQFVNNPERLLAEYENIRVLVTGVMCEGRERGERGGFQQGGGWPGQARASSFR
jgi:hypothetical protein